MDLPATAAPATGHVLATVGHLSQVSHAEGRVQAGAAMRHEIKDISFVAIGCFVVAEEHAVVVAGYEVLGGGGAPIGRNQEELNV